MAASPTPTPHIAAREGDIAPFAIMPGDPLRARHIATTYLDGARCVNEVRGMLAYTGTWKGVPVTVMGSGMGMPSMGIYSYELFHFYGVERIVRVGTAGGYADDLALRDVVAAQGACTNSRFAHQFKLPGTFAPLASFDLLEAAVAAERAALEEHDLIVFQFPVYWYSAPALLRTWTDEVYGFGWAYGGEAAEPGEPGRKLAGKKFAVAMCAGDIEANYCAEGTVGFTPSEVIVPFRATANYVGATCEPEPFCLFGTENGLTDEALEASSAAYVEWLRAL